MSACLCSKRHSPVPRVLHVHHILPLSWSGPDVPANRVTLCPSTHTNVHKLLDAYVTAGGEPHASVLGLYNDLTRRLALMAWDQRPPNPTRTSLIEP